ncbi:ABC transporter substrate-binding protein [Halegenticoccus tardaugens]|uniref:ABC transporter substrate-binding protein n=1 Tax=Halegenticoccus tardaugens TaxID=2071624 RepID=UPI00100AF667|nr:ABC transporter substrate-binding protein [Halegenticoccus tardaugens]
MRRRELLGVGAGALTTALAGCTDAFGDSGNGGSNGDGNQSDGDGSSDGESYTVSMVPVGEVEFDGVPERWVAYETGYGEMGIALGQVDGLAAVGEKDRFYTHYFDELDGVDVDLGSMTELINDSFQIDKELFYEIDADVHVIDPNWIVDGSSFGLEQEDVDEIAEGVAPFIGNTIFRRTDDWHDYEYYSMYEAFEKVAQVFQQQERYEAFKSIHDDYVEEVQSKLPDERPAALLTYGDGDQPEEFSPYRVTDKGTDNKHLHDLGIEDALTGTGISGLSTTDRGTIDYEAMLEVDPDVILVRGHETKTAEEFQNTVVAFMKDHDVASELAAVQNDMVFRGGPIYQGPIQHLFVLERTAKDLFPDAFEGELFDRNEVANVITGQD